MMKKIFIKTDQDKTYHFITIRDNTNPEKSRRIPHNSYNELEKYLIKQPKDKDVFISKYRVDKIVQTIILDFDSDENKKDAYIESKQVMDYLKDVGLNSFIVDSTNKGYHLYIQIPPKVFRFKDFDDRLSNLLFNHFVDFVININEFDYNCLDIVNTHAGLGGNIRVIGSIHPRTGERVRIIEGSFEENPSCYKPFSKGYVYIDECMKNAYNLMKEEINNPHPKIKEGIYNNEDLRKLMPQLFYLEKVKNYGDAIWCCCPFHNDNSPSFCITKDFYFCTSCETKGNIFTLIKEGYYKPKMDVYSVSKRKFITL